jgi:hypothetical protein
MFDRFLVGDLKSIGIMRASAPGLFDLSHVRQRFAGPADGQKPTQIRAGDGRRPAVPLDKSSHKKSYGMQAGSRRPPIGIPSPPLGEGGLVGDSFINCRLFGAGADLKSDWPGLF